MSHIVTIENDLLAVSISTKGAELQSIVYKPIQQEYMWNADPNFWAKKSPVLFPIVGGLKNNTYTYNGKNYVLSRHGFAREAMFEITAQNNESVTLSIQSNENTLAVYPFTFKFSIEYTLVQNTLNVAYHTTNTGSSEMYFSVGAHPAFTVPLIENTSFDDYYLHLNMEENAGIYPLDATGLLELNPHPFLNSQQTIPLTKPLFYKDALVFKNLQSTEISLLNNKNKHGLTVSYKGFPFMGIWSFKDANFVCIEPWCGIADSTNTTGDLVQKEGIMLLEPLANSIKCWNVKVF